MGQIEIDFNFLPKFVAWTKEKSEPNNMLLFPCFYLKINIQRSPHPGLQTSEGTVRAVPDPVMMHRPLSGELMGDPVATVSPDECLQNPARAQAEEPAAGIVT